VLVIAELGAPPYGDLEITRALRAKVDAAFFPGTTVKSNFLCNLGYGDGSKLHPRSPRLDFDEACLVTGARALAEAALRYLQIAGQSPRCLLLPVPVWRYKQGRMALSHRSFPTELPVISSCFGMAGVRLARLRFGEGHGAVLAMLSDEMSVTGALPVDTTYWRCGC